MNFVLNLICDTSSACEFIGCLKRKSILYENVRVFGLKLYEKETKNNQINFILIYLFSVLYDLYERASLELRDKVCIFSILTRLLNK